MKGWEEGWGRRGGGCVGGWEKRGCDVKAAGIIYLMALV